FLRLASVKMSKSLGNFITIREALERHPAEALRLAMLQTHYRSPLEFSDEAVVEARSALGRMYETIARIGAPLDLSAGKGGGVEEARACREEVRAALADDMNTPRALAALHDGIRAANRFLDAGRADEARSVAAALRDVGSVLGLLQGDPVATLAAW